MKKILSLGVLFSFSLLLIGCDNELQKSETKQPPISTETAETPASLEKDVLNTKNKNSLDMEDILDVDNLEKFDYRATIKMTPKDGSPDMPMMQNMIMEFDAPNKTRIRAQSPMGEMESIETDGTIYTKMGGKWIKISNEEYGIDGDQGSFSTEDVNEMLDSPTLKYIGKEDCAVGTCKVYQNSLESTGGENTLIYIDPNKKLPIRIKVEMESGTIVMDYEYTDISIEIPKISEEKFQMPDLNTLEGIDMSDFKNMEMPDMGL